MARRVFLHIGAPKSGTSYLQDKLALNRPLLASQGLAYPETRSGSHFEAALDLIERRWAGELDRARGQWQALADTAAKASGDVVVSHEILAAARADQVSRAFASFAEDEIHVVYTVRDLARQIPAEWQESVKHRSLKTFQRFLRQVVEAPRTNSELWFWRVQSLPDVLSRWSNGLPPERVHVVTVPQPDGPRGALWERFASVLGLDPGLPYAESDRTNASLGIAEVSLLRRLNRRLGDAEISRETYVDLVRELIVREVLSERDEMQPATVPAARRGFVEEVTGEWLDWLEGSRVDVVGDLADLRPVWPQHDAHVVHPDKPAPGKVIDAALDALTAVIVESDNTNLREDLQRPVRRIGRRLWGS